MPQSKTQRWLDLIAFLVRHRMPVDVDQIMKAVPAYRGKWLSDDEADRAAVRRMFERDKDELRDAGIPLRTVEYTIDHGAETVVGYRLAGRDFYLPYLRIAGAGRTAPPAAPEVEITGDEAWTAIEALRRVAALPDSPFADEARSALRKLAFDLDLEAIGDSPVHFAGAAPVASARPGFGVRRFDGRELRRDAGAAGGTRDVLASLTDALRRRKRVRFAYHGIRRGEATDRDVAPYGLLFQHGHWYLIGHDATRGAVRVFRVGRMDPPVVERGDAPDYEIPADFRMADHAAREAWELGDDAPVAALVRFDFPLALWADRNRRGERVEERAGGAQVRRFQVRQVDPFLRWLQTFGGEALVLEPHELRDAQVRMARETLAAYGADG